MVNKLFKSKLILFCRLKVLLQKEREMIKLIPHAEDAEERLSTDNTKDADPADILKLK